MADAVTLTIIIVGSMLGIMVLYFVFLSARIYVKGRRSLVKTPKLRGRNILRSEDFGSAEGIGYEPLGFGDKSIVRLRLRDGQVIAPVYYNNQILPDNPIQAFCGGESSLWHVVGKAMHYTDEEKKQLTIENKKLRDEEIKKDMKHKTDINEAATLPDELKEIYKEAFKTGKTESVSVVRQK